MAKLRVGVVFGGRSGEHEVSLVSAAAVLAALDPKRYEVIPIGITREGRWRLGRSGMLPPTVLAQGTALRLQPQPLAADTPALRTVESAPPALRTVDSAPPALRAADEHAPRLDVILPILHGPFGEDGSVQGFFELAGVPYAGSGVLGSAVAMDKDVMKRLFREAGLPVGPYCRVLRTEWDRHPQAGVRTIERELRYPLFVKPANLGSSVGISKVHNRGELAPAMALASGYDEKVVVEQGIEGRELECAVLGNDPPLASALGEIIAGREFYDYDAKYSDAGSRTLVPAPVSARVAERVRRLAIRAFQATECRDLARVDFFLEQGTGKVWLNEINSLPGFTPISMFPQLWAASGVGFSELLDRLIGFALERSRRPAADAASMVK
ncbi:MAG TPA: D-alanine--D-alanine ligase family protein [Terriglobales bacterium]|nr:D-alanine--D-alanine ligase family protein [Terriglobales bacterium]